MMKTFSCFFLSILLSFTSINAQDVPAVNAQIIPVNDSCSVGNYCVLLQVQGINGASYLGNSSIFFTYDPNVIYFEGSSINDVITGSYTSINFDDDQTSLNSDCLGGMGFSPYSSQAFDGFVDGEFLITLVLEAPTIVAVFACPSISTDWVSISEICFDVIDPLGDPNIQILGEENMLPITPAWTNFNSDSNQPEDKYNNGSFNGTNATFDEVCEDCDGDYDCENICNGTAVIDECGVCNGTGPSTWYADLDGDGLGDLESPIVDCEQPMGYVLNGDDDCDLIIDCDGICGGESVIDECGVCNGTGPSTWYADLDGDGLGDDMNVFVNCSQPMGYVSNGDDDCDLVIDCEGVCDGESVIDECGVCNGSGPSIWYADLDDDGLGDVDNSVTACEQPMGYVANAEDENDLPAAVNVQLVGLIDSCETGLYCMALQIEGVNDADYVGISSIRFSYDENVLGFSGNSLGGVTNGSYTSVNFDDDQTTLDQDCIDGLGFSPYSEHGFDGLVPGDFLLTFVLEASTIGDNVFACPNIENEWTTVSHICFEVLNPLGDPDLVISGLSNSFPDMDGTAFNNDLNNGTAVYNNGNFLELHTSFENLCDGCENGVLDCDGVCGGNNIGQAWYLDADGDGLGNANIDSFSCTQPVGYVGNGNDFDDENAIDVLSATVDNICNVDEETLEVLITFFNVDEPLFYYFCDDPSTIIEVFTDGSMGFVALGPFPNGGAEAPEYCVQFLDLFGNPVSIENNINPEDDYADGTITLSSVFCDPTVGGENALASMVETVCNDEDGTFDVVVSLFNVEDSLFYYLCDDTFNVLEVITEGSFGFAVLTGIPSDQGDLSSFCIQFVDDNNNPVFIVNETTGEADFTDGIIDDTNVTCVKTALKLSSFKGEVFPNHNQLNWEILSTENSKIISLQSSQDGQVFNNIAEFPLVSSSNQTQGFEYLDKDFYRETTYYRLVEADINGNEKVVSDIIGLQRKEADSNWSFYPNPVKDVLSISTNQLAHKTTTLSVYSSLGVLVKQETIILEKGNNQLFLDMTNYPSGVYFLSIVEGRVMKKIIR